MDNIGDALKKAAEKKKDAFEIGIPSSKPGFCDSVEYKKQPSTPAPIPPKATVNRAKIVDPRIVAYYEDNGKILEDYRALLTQILSIQEESGKVLKTIALTSSREGEGKSITALNMSIILAKNYKKKTLIMDCNIRNPGINTLLGINIKKGLSDILREDIPFSVEILETGIDKLSMIPAGEIYSNPAQVFASERMKSLLEEIKKQFDIIILDTPAVIPYADPRILAPLVDGVLLVIQSGRVRREVVQRTESILQEVGANILGCLLTGVEYYIPEYIHRHL
ncbi:MAG: CpsD/CapB family tyrosine-protein kinase [Candidatus Aureabacteria bacterium]|nr:CpsD/CapB family tyrosine-protein kinase [Candidatus Auribacterota bacterium]